MERFYCVANYKKKEAIDTARRLCDALRARGKECHLAPQEKAAGKGFLYTDPARVPEGIDCIIVSGGDGTLIQAAGDLCSLRIPFLGINCGTLGYLTEVESDRAEELLERLLAGEYETEERMMLTGSVIRDGKEIYRARAVNDIVINRSGVLRIIDLHVSVNGQPLTRYSADGVLVATPTGSTAYNLSAGGPIVSPSAQVMLMTPICAHTINNRTIVLSPEDELTITVGKGRYEENEPRIVSFDGMRSCSVYDGDVITIRRSHQVIPLIKMSKMSFLEVLRRKMGDL